MANQPPLTWACLCGQMNLLSDKECCVCAESRDDGWDPNDRKRAVISYDTKDPNARERIIGFDAT